MDNFHFCKNQLTTLAAQHLPSADLCSRSRLPELGGAHLASQSQPCSVQFGLGSHVPDPK
jgi:hypothetical protein